MGAMTVTTKTETEIRTRQVCIKNPRCRDPSNLSSLRLSFIEFNDHPNRLNGDYQDDDERQQDEEEPEGGEDETEMHFSTRGMSLFNYIVPRHLDASIGLLDTSSLLTAEKYKYEKAMKKKAALAADDEDEAEAEPSPRKLRKRTTKVVEGLCYQLFVFILLHLSQHWRFRRIRPYPSKKTPERRSSGGGER